MDRRLLKSEKQLEKRLKKLKKEDFECEADTLKAAFRPLSRSYATTS
jgi:transposase